MFGLIDAGFIPRVAVNVPYHPHIIHCVTGRTHLLVGVVRFNAKEGAVGDFLNVVAHKSRTEALGVVELILIKLGLGVVVRRVARPSAGVVEDLAENHI